jgi:hypothetical protein
MLKDRHKDEWFTLADVDEWQFERPEGSLLPERFYISYIFMEGCIIDPTFYASAQW